MVTYLETYTKWLLTCSLLLGFGCAFEDIDTLELTEAGEAMQKVRFGETCSSDTYPATVSLFAVTNVGVQSFCTGTVIAPDVVLTAAHCLDEVEGFEDRLGVSFDEQIDAIEDAAAQIAFWATHPEYRAGNTDFDIALVFLRQTVSVDFPLLLDPQEGQFLRPGLPLNLIGYGWPEIGEATGTRRCGESVLQTGNGLILGFSERTPDQTFSGLCGGDSGGPVYLDMITSEGLMPRVVGVNQTAVQRCGAATAVRTDTFVPWIDEVMELACSEELRTDCSVQDAPTSSSRGEPIAEAYPAVDAAYEAEMLEALLDYSERCTPNGIATNFAAFARSMYWLAEQGCQDAQLAFGDFYQCMADNSCTPVAACEEPVLRYLDLADVCADGDFPEGFGFFTSSNNDWGVAPEPLNAPVTLDEAIAPLCRLILSCEDGLDESDTNSEVYTFCLSEGRDSNFWAEGCPEGRVALQDWYQCVYDTGDCTDLNNNGGQNILEQCAMDNREALRQASQNCLTPTERSGPPGFSGNLDELGADSSSNDSDDDGDENAPSKSGCASSNGSTALALMGIAMLFWRRRKRLCLCD